MASDLAAGAPIWAGPDRKKTTLGCVFAEYQSPRRRRAVKAVYVEMRQPFVESLRGVVEAINGDLRFLVRNRGAGAGITST